MLMQGFAVAGTPENLMIALIGCFIGTVVGLLIFNSMMFGLLANLQDFFSMNTY